MILLSVMACSIELARPSGPTIQQVRKLDPFSEVLATASVDVVITMGSTQRVTVEAPAEHLDSILLDVDGDRLTVGSAAGVFRGGRRVHVTIPHLTAITNRSNGDIEVHGLAAPALQVGIGGSGDVDLHGSTDALTAHLDASGSLTATDLAGSRVDVIVEGAGDATLDGTIGRLDAVLGGSGDLTIADLRGEVEARLDGSGDLDLDGRITGVQVQSTAAGHISCSGIDADTVYVALDGSGDAELQGQAATLRAQTTASGSVAARELTVMDAQVRATGSGDIELNAFGTVIGEVDRPADLVVAGAAVVSTSGTGDVIR